MLRHSILILASSEPSILCQTEPRYMCNFLIDLIKGGKKYWIERLFLIKIKQDLYFKKKKKIILWNAILFIIVLDLYRKWHKQLWKKRFSVVDGFEDEFFQCKSKNGGRALSHSVLKHSNRKIYKLLKKANIALCLYSRYG